MFYLFDIRELGNFIMFYVKINNIYKMVIKSIGNEF